jgi:hypothetical protein
MYKKKKRGIYNFFKPKELKKKTKVQGKTFCTYIYCIMFLSFWKKKKKKLSMCRGVLVFSHNVLVTKELPGGIIIFLSF